MSRIKVPQLKSRDEFLAAVDEAARCALEIKRLESIRNVRIQQIQDEFAGTLTVIGDRLDLLTALADGYAETHREELLFGKIKSAETPLAIFGFRTGMPQLKLKSKMTWEKVVAVLISEKRELWLRTKIEAAKDAIISGCQARPETAAIADRIGMRIVQEETFFIEPKVDGAEQIKASAAK